MFNKKYSILVLGSNGMLGFELYQNLISASANKNSNIGTVIGIDVKDGIDLTKCHALGDYLMNSIHFDYCINCVAHTDTKVAETTVEGKALDFKLNALAPKYIAESCKYWKTKLIHISTDYVFSEKSVSAAWDPNNIPIPFKPDSEPFPTNVYGMNKLLGEKFIEEAFGKESKNYCICRVSWLYSMHNRKSFIHKFMNNVVQLAAEGKSECEMTSNEWSVPTSCEYVIDAIRQMIGSNIHGMYHAIPFCEDKGVSRLEFAKEILSWYKDIKINDSCLADISLVGVERDSYWPKYSVMKSSAIESMDWKQMLDRFMKKNYFEILLDAKENIGIL